jgi:hypothetical protein
MQVRWQFEEDIEECNSCRVHFSGRKKKANCRHCGRIFCPDCLSKQVRANHIEEDLHCSGSVGAVSFLAHGSGSLIFGTYPDPFNCKHNGFLKFCGFTLKTDVNVAENKSKKQKTFGEKLTFVDILKVADKKDPYLLLVVCIRIHIKTLRIRNSEKEFIERNPRACPPSL